MLHDRPSSFDLLRIRQLNGDVTAKNILSQAVNKMRRNGCILCTLFDESCAIRVRSSRKSLYGLMTKEGSWENFSECSPALSFLTTE